MSTLGGIYNFDDSKVDHDAAVTLAIGLLERGPDGGGEYKSNSLFMVYRAFHTNKESRCEKQPFVSRWGHVLCWDGRLDNREELITQLKDHLTDDRTDVAIVMAGYVRQGTDFLAHLIGDFALSLWDPFSHTLLLARDGVGPRPLFYQVDKEKIVWSSELAPLLQLVKNLEIDDDYVAAHLLGLFEPGFTPYREIQAVLPGHYLIVTDGQLQQRRFWGLNPQLRIRYRNDDEYEEHFRHLLREAIRCRMRVDGPIWAQLSGGLDSSSIVCIADELVSTGRVQATRLETVSYVYDKSSSSDERSFITSVEEKRGRPGYHLRDEDNPPLSVLFEDSELTFPDFLDCFANRQKRLCGEMRSDGARVLLTGHGGDQLLVSNALPSPIFRDLLIQRQILSLHRSLQTWSDSLKRPYFDLLVRDCLGPWLPRKLQVTLGLQPKFRLPDWYDQKFVSRMRMRERNLGLKDEFGFRLPSEREQASEFLAGMRVISKASYRLRGCIEVSHPYLHRPLAEFLQAIPFDQKLRPGQTRSLMRRALEDSVPQKVLLRKSKRGPEEALFRAVAKEWQWLQEIFKNAECCARGYIDGNALKETLNRVRHGCGRNSFALIQTISLEFWLRALVRRNSTSKKVTMSRDASAAA